MSEKLDDLVKDLPEEPADVHSLAELRQPTLVSAQLPPLGKWLRVPNGPYAVGDELLSALLGHGKTGLLRIFEAYVAETMRTDDEAAALFEALRIVTRQGRSMKAISWNLDDVKRESSAKARVLVLLEHDINARMRAAAGARADTLSGFIEDAIRERLARIEGRPRRNAVEPGPEKAAASA